MSLTIGSTHAITWTSEDILDDATGIAANVKIEISRNGGNTWATITAGTVNDGAYSWIVSSPDAANCIIRVSNSTDASVYDDSVSFEIIKDVTMPIAITGLESLGSRQWRLTGSGFKPAATDPTVSIGGVAAVINSATDTVVVLTASALTPSGTQTLTIENSGGNTTTISGDSWASSDAVSGIISIGTLTSVTYDADALTLTWACVSGSANQYNIRLLLNGVEPTGTYTLQSDSIGVLTLVSALAAGTYDAQLINGDGEYSNPLAGAVVVAGAGGGVDQIGVGAAVAVGF